jgi:endonuclease YncB( thermonuclease family)
MHGFEPENYWHDAGILRGQARRARLNRLAIFGVGFTAGWLAATALMVGVSAARAETLTGRVQVIDGDTVWHYPTSRSESEKIRLLDIDAPETTRPSCERELIAGLRAKARLAELLQRRPLRIERCDEHGEPCEDRFGRTLARLHTPAGEVGAILLREGLALKYEPGRKAERNAHWCGG